MSDYLDGNRGLNVAKKQGSGAKEDLGTCQHCKVPRVEQPKGPPACPRGCESTQASPPVDW